MSAWKILWYGETKKPEAIGTEARKQQTGLQIGVVLAFLTYGVVAPLLYFTQ